MDKTTTWKRLNSGHFFECKLCFYHPQLNENGRKNANVSHYLWAFYCNAFIWNAFVDREYNSFFVLSVFLTLSSRILIKKIEMVAYEWTLIFGWIWTEQIFHITIHYDDGLRSNKHEISEFTQVANKQASDDTIIYDKLMKAQESHKHDHSVCKNVIAVQCKGKTRLHFHFELPSNELSTCFYWDAYSQKSGFSKHIWKSDLNMALIYTLFEFVAILASKLCH